MTTVAMMTTIMTIVCPQADACHHLAGAKPSARSAGLRYTGKALRVWCAFAFV